MTLRNLARIGATGALAVGGLGFAATPALAADVDFAVELSGTTIAAGTPTKSVKLTFENNGTTKPDKVEVTFDSRGLDAKKVTLEDAIFDDPTCSRAATRSTGPSRSTTTMATPTARSRTRLTSRSRRCGRGAGPGTTSRPRMRPR